MTPSTPSRRVLVTPRSLTQQGLASVAELSPLTAAGFELIGSEPGQSPSESDLRTLLDGVEGWIAGVEAIGARVIGGADALKVIARNGSGVDNIDVAAAERAGIRVTAAPGANAQGVAELAVTLVLSCIRRVPWSAALVKEGGWHRPIARELSELTIGVVGLGAIGRRVAASCSALGAHVIAHDPYVGDCDVEQAELNELLAASDVVSLHLPPTADGRPLLGAVELSLLPDGAIVVNTARASLVDDDAMLYALDAGAVAAYAVDAFASEPPSLTRLLLHQNVLATPHLGAFTTGSVRRATSAAVDSILSVLSTP